MKNVSGAIITVLILLSCSTPPDSSKNDQDKVASDFAMGLETGDIELLMSAYHQNADFTFIDLDGNKNILNGAEEIREAQQANFEQGMLAAEVLVDTWKKENNGDSIRYRIIVSFDAFQFMNTLELITIDGDWGIIHQKVEFYSVK